MMKTLSKRLFCAAAFSIPILLVVASSAQAVEKCKVKTGKDGTIRVSAKKVVGFLTWGESQVEADRPFFNAETCLQGEIAKNCTLGPDLDGKIPPEECTVFLADESLESPECEVWVKGCTPGSRLILSSEDRLDMVQFFEKVSVDDDDGRSILIQDADLFFIDDATYAARGEGARGPRFALEPGVCTGGGYPGDLPPRLCAFGVDAFCNDVCIAGAPATLGAACTDALDCGSGGVCSSGAACTRPTGLIATSRAVIIEGANLIVRSGEGSTGAAVNGYGNVIIGYNENWGGCIGGELDGGLCDDPGFCIDSGGICLLRDKRGSHNLIVGADHGYGSYSGVVSGESSTLAARNSAVLAGNMNVSGGDQSAIVGGYENVASGPNSVIIGGDRNYTGRVCVGRSFFAGVGQPCASNGDCAGGNSCESAYGNTATVVGGNHNSGVGDNSVEVGGTSNAALTAQATVIGGADNVANGNGATVSGGYGNYAGKACVGGGNDGDLCFVASECASPGVCTDGDLMTVSGGSENRALSADRAVISGGRNNKVTGDYSTISGGASRTVSGTDDWKAGTLFEDN